MISLCTLRAATKALSSICSSWPGPDSVRNAQCMQRRRMISGGAGWLSSSVFISITKSSTLYIRIWVYNVYVLHILCLMYLCEYNIWIQFNALYMQRSRNDWAKCFLTFFVDIANSSTVTNYAYAYLLIVYINRMFYIIYYECILILIVYINSIY